MNIKVKNLERDPSHLLKATSHSKFCFVLIYLICPTVSGPNAPQKVPVICYYSYILINFSEMFNRIFLK